MSDSNPSQNIPELAKQGDAIAIATLLTNSLRPDYDLIASAIRLGNYLSVLVETTGAADADALVSSIQDILQTSVGKMITTVVITAQQVGHGVLWSETVELDTDESQTDRSQADGSQIDGSQVNELAADTTDPADGEKTSAIISTPAQETGGEDPWTIAFKHLLQRPELVAVMAFAIAIAFWDAYVHWVGDTNPSKPLSANKLARRLGVHRTIISRQKHRKNFEDWSQELDPDGIAWQYDGKVFLPKV